MTYTSRKPYNSYRKAAVKPPVAPTRVIRAWSPYQTDLFSDIANGVGNTQVDALAGSGKTSSIVEGFYHMKSSLKALMVAFNKSIQTELSARAPQAVTVSTLHSLGYKACRKAFPRIGQPDNQKLDGYIVAEVGDDSDNYDLRESLKKAVSLAKGYLAESYEDIDPILDRHGVDLVEESREAFIVKVQKLMKACKNDTNRVDFDDMIWFPNVHGLKLESYDMVFIDEAQDLNIAQINLALNSCGPNGRIISVGDEHQAIYGFRGADSNAIKNIVDRCNSKRLPLSVTYRCATSIVDLAKTLVPNLEAAPNAEQGLVETIGERSMEKMVAPGDFILSRTNAPLIKWCLTLLKARVRANIQGKDMGKNLIAMLKKSKASNVIEFLGWLEEWKNTEIERLVALKRDPSVIQDKAECFEILCEGTRSIKEVKANIEDLFHDGDDKDRVILSTTHKAKGLERDRVFMLKDTYKPGKTVEETNLTYVAYTRAKRELYLVGKQAA